MRRLHRWLLIPGDAKGWGRQITGIGRARPDRHAGLGPRAALAAPREQREDVAEAESRRSAAAGLHRSLHAVVGTWVLPIYLVMTLTGLWYSFDWYKDGVVWLLSRPRRQAAAKMQPQRRRAQPDARDRFSRSASIVHGRRSSARRAAASQGPC